MSYPVDILTGGDWEDLKQSSEVYLSRLCDSERESTESFTLPNGEKVAVTLSSLAFLQIHSEHWILALPSSQAVVAVYLAGRWWSVDDALKTSDITKQELSQVQSVGERIVLYLLNRIIYGRREFVAGSIPFLAHPEKQLAKIFWKDSEAVGFYTVKQKGSLCTDCTSQCYWLPVLDTVFVRQKHRRQGIGLNILQDFCSTFSDDEALGISTPISAAMYQGQVQVLLQLYSALMKPQLSQTLWIRTPLQDSLAMEVCSKYLQTQPQEQDRLWEVEAPGDWNQRVNVWLQLQMGDVPSENSTSSCQSRDGESDSGSTEEDITRQLPHETVPSLQPEFSQVILEPSEGVTGQASGSLSLKNQSSRESNVVEGKSKGCRGETGKAPCRKRSNTSLSQAPSSKQTKSMDSEIVGTADAGV